VASAGVLTAFVEHLAPQVIVTGLTRTAAIAMCTCIAACTSHPSTEQGAAQHAAVDLHAGHPVASSAAPGSTDRRVPAINKTPAPGPAPDGMGWIPGGEFWMGCQNCGMPDALPVHLAYVDGFWMDRTPVTNAEFERFVAATGYVTVAERKPDSREFPSAPPEMLVPGSAVFAPPPGPVPLDSAMRWWRYMPGASWRHPEGPQSTLRARANHPVVHVAWDDAAAYAKWVGKRLPTEAEFEFAARGGLDRSLYAWGNELMPGGRPVANIWQGHFPDANTRADGYAGTSPVDAFPPNEYGLHDMGGNVWQWCADWYRPDAYNRAARVASTARNPRGPEDSDDPEEPGLLKRVTRGGSFLCTGEYCARYLVGSRGKAEINSGSANLGFRLAKSQAD
jgi:formylglycine-generating enzyme required for sulfatase activity